MPTPPNRSAQNAPRFGGDPGAFCDRCGAPADEGDHVACRQARRLEPPRYCARCRRRMIVQVTPTGWSARCVEHGELTSA